MIQDYWSFLLGLGMAMLGGIVAFNWRGAADKYTFLIDALVPRRPNQRLTPDEAHDALLRQQRIIFAVVGLLGAGIVIQGLVSLL